MKINRSIQIVFFIFSAICLSYSKRSQINHEISASSSSVNPIINEHAVENTAKLLRNNYRTYRSSIGQKLLFQKKSKFRSRKNILTQYHHNKLKLNRKMSKSTCENQACYPPIKNLLVGRKKYLFASSTCGLKQSEQYCTWSSSPTSSSLIDTSLAISNLRQNYILPFYSFFNENTSRGVFCYICDSSEANQINEYSHRVENIIKEYKSTESANNYDVILNQFQNWWQSANDVQHVFIRFDLESEFLLSHILIKFKSYPPKSMFMEKSEDFGRSWKPIAYYALDCQQAFPNITRNKPTDIRKAYCKNIQISSSNSVSNHVLYKPLAGLKHIDPFDLQNFLKITNLRVHLTSLFQPTRDYIGLDKEPTAYNFYAINELKVLGSCFCNGHASSCTRDKSVQYDRESVNLMIHSKCKCEHNTAGDSCERCLPLYNDRPWYAGRYNMMNECKQCQCNNHATSCHFNETLYIATNGETGGVCDDCMHNTEGVNCERCKYNYYRDSSVPFQSPDSCKPCNCNPLGALNTNPKYPVCSEKSCRCKRYVHGKHCDECKNGFFNLTLAHGDNGCEPCPCYLYGTDKNLGCNKQTGRCYPCKINVMGKRCDECKTGFYGLDSSPEGCKPCNCHEGHSYSDDCNKVTGQCFCKPYTYGLQCNLMMPGYFTPRLENVIAKGQDAQILNKYSFVEFEFKKGMKNVGLVNVVKGSVIKFRFTHKIKTGLYEIVLRLSKILPEDVDLVLLGIVTNLGLDARHYNENSKSNLCSDEIQMSTKKFNAILAKNQTFSVISDYCFKQFYNYELVIKFFDNPLFNINYLMIDSIAIFPFHQPNELSNRIVEPYQACLNAYLSFPSNESDYCDHVLSLEAAKFFGILPCQCSTTGSYDNYCKQYGGECNCKPNVIGRECNQCKSKSWGFSPNGCLECNCSIYSYDESCDLRTGQCYCPENFMGKTCHECSIGYFNSPFCQKCRCNGLSKTCNESGICMDCQGNAEGENCERCKKGYYGNPKHKIPCRKCACPDINNNNFASECVESNENSHGFKCSCKKGYIGDRCEKCAPLYYGNPLEVGGSCKKCNCNGNVDENDAESCDRKTGECRKCLNNTHGFRCEKCKPGFYKNPNNYNKCEPCKCNRNGTINNSENNCDPETGICWCLSNVIGIKCTECASGYWNLESKEGCVSCDCDTSGTIYNETYCEQETGSCICADDRGGRVCNECPTGYWGTPPKCRKCECVANTTIEQICDKSDGKCLCLPAYTGYNCDRCAKRAPGSVPNCMNCGECFDYWSDRLAFFNNEIDRISSKSLGSLMLPSEQNSLSVFHISYERLGKKLVEINRLTTSFQEKDSNLTSLSGKVKIIKNKVDRVKNEGHKKSKDAKSWVLEEIFHAKKAQYSSLNDNTNKMLKLAFELKESFINGARITIEEAKRSSDDSLRKVQSARTLFENEFATTINKLKENLSEESLTTEKSFANIKLKFDRNILLNQQLEKSLTNLNKIVCGSSQLNCSDECGGLLCETCAVDMRSELSPTSKCNDSLKAKYFFYEKFITEIQTNFESKETQLKKYLNQLNGQKNLAKKMNQENLELQAEFTTTLNEISQKKNQTSQVLLSIYKQTDVYISTKKDIETNCHKIDQLKEQVEAIEVEKKFESIGNFIENVNQNATWSNIALKSPLSEAIQINEQIDQRYEKLIKFPTKIRVLSEVKDSVKATNAYLFISTSNFSEKTKEIGNKISNTKLVLKNVNFEFEYMNSERESLEQRIQETEKANADEDMKRDRINLKLSALDNNLARIFMLLNDLSQDVKSMIQRVIEETVDPDERDDFRALINLQNKLFEKQQEYIRKVEKMEALKNEKELFEIKLKSVKEEFVQLRTRAIDLNVKISEKATFLKTCQ